MRTRSLIAICLALSGCMHFRSSVTGTVFEYTAPRQVTPVAGANVRIECYQAVGYHQSRKVRDLEYVTNEKGQYNVSSAAQLQCDEYYAHASKEGYVDPASIGITFPGAYGQEVPDTLYLVVTARANMARLERINMGELMSNRPAALYDYYFRHFYESTLVAQAPAEREYVVANYCSRLTTNWKAMSEAERDAAVRHTFLVTQDRKVETVLINPEVVSEWCGPEL